LTKAIALLSGGLDSILAVRLLLDQGIEVESVNFVSVFGTFTSKSGSRMEAKVAAERLGVELTVFNYSKDLMELIRQPRYGYGKNMNPCIDCRVFTFKKAREYMRQRGASFLITGEVLGERPMSQRRDSMRIIERDSGSDGLLLRPLSAKLLPPTVAEEEGLVDRDKLLSIQGRSRKPQIALARELGIDYYPSPAGGCLLTDPGFARRMRDLMEHDSNFTLNDVRLLKIGRHFRLSNTAKAIVGRNEKENKKLGSLAVEGDLIFKVLGFTGPLTLVRGNLKDHLSELPASITAWYGKAKNEIEVDVSYIEHSTGKTGVARVSPLEQERLKVLMI